MSASFFHMGLSCKDPAAVESFYTRHFGFRRARVYAPGPDQVVMIKSGNLYLELFKASGEAPAPPAGGAGPEYPGWRHIALYVDDLDATMAGLGSDVAVTLGPLDMGEFIPGMRVTWISDPEGNIVELSQGYRDEDDPPAFSAEQGA